MTTESTRRLSAPSLILAGIIFVAGTLYQPMGPYFLDWGDGHIHSLYFFGWPYPWLQTGFSPPIDYLALMGNLVIAISAGTLMAWTLCRDVRGRWLIFASLLLIFLIEFSPVAPDELYFWALTSAEAKTLVGYKMLFLFIILVPIYVFLRLNGSGACNTMLTRTGIISAVVATDLLMNAGVVVRWWRLSG